MKYRRQTMRISVFAEGDNAVFGESAIHVEIDDDAAGPYLVLRSSAEGNAHGMVCVDFEQWEQVEAAARELMAGCRGEYGIDLAQQSIEALKTEAAKEQK